MKRLLTILLALVMVLALGTSAFADGTGSITVENATVGQEYAGYKIFDATWAGDDKVAYTIDSTSYWFSLAQDSTSPFKLVQIGSGNVYNVLVKGGENDASIRDWVLDQTPEFDPDLEAKIAAVTTVNWEDVPYGYYLVTSKLGALVTVSNVNDNIIIIDKNQQPGWEKPDPEGETQSGKNVSADGNDYGPTSTAAMGDTVHFKINAFVPKYHGDKQVYEYIFTDTLDKGLSYLDGLSVFLNDETLVQDSGDIKHDYRVDIDGQKITIKVYAYGIAAYPTDAHLEIKFQASVNKDAKYINKNNAEMSWTEFDPTKDIGDDPEGDNYPKEPEETLATSTTKTYVYGFKLQKYAEEVGDDAELNGATFLLYDAETGGGQIPVVLAGPEVPGVYRVALPDEECVEIEAGFATIFGLDTGIYWLEETGAPAGYNPLTARQQVEITRTNVDDDGYVASPVSIINKTGTVLPETGGIGTKIFYIVGGILALGALVILVSRRRMVNGR